MCTCLQRVILSGRWPPSTVPSFASPRASPQQLVPILALQVGLFMNSPTGAQVKEQDWIQTQVFLAPDWTL